LQNSDRAAAQAEQFHFDALEKDLATLSERQRALTVRAPFDGKVIAPNLERVSGLFVQLGEPILTVASLENLRVISVLSDADVGSFRSGSGKEVRIKFGSNPNVVFKGTLERVHPSATNEAPPPVLANTAGGPVILDPKTPDGSRTLLPWYRADIVLDAGQVEPPVGTGGTVRFVVGKDSIGEQFWLRFRRMLHRRFLI
jgi:hypothetical protein